MVKRQKLREKKLPKFMSSTETALPNTTHRFFVENHTENGQVLSDLYRIEDFVDSLDKRKKKQIFKTNPEAEK